MYPLGGPLLISSPPPFFFSLNNNNNKTTLYLLNAGPIAGQQGSSSLTVPPHDLVIFPFKAGMGIFQLLVSFI